VKHPTAQRKPLVISYLRFSTREQAKGDSFRRQAELAAAFCKRKGWSLSEKTYQDLGVSAFKGKNALVGNLGEFLKAVETGAVPPGSVLIVESLDRISRQGIDAGYDLIKKILKAGIILVTLTPEREFDENATKGLSKGALEIQLILERAAEESERRAERIRASWANKRDHARAGKEMLPRRVDGRVTRSMTDTLPAWIQEKNGKLVPILPRVKTIKRIFALAAKGYGRHRIIAALKAEGFPSLTGKPVWPACSIGFILVDRRVLGEYQPHKLIDDPNRKSGYRRGPDGEPIKGYYPAAIKEHEWLAARAGTASRRRQLGVRPSRSDKPTNQDKWTAAEDALVRKLPVSTAARKLDRTRAAIYQRRVALGLSKRQSRISNTNSVNIFNGLVRNALPPFDSFIVATRYYVGGPAKSLLNSAHAEGGAKAAPCYQFPLAVFERAVLGAILEINPKDVLPEQPSDVDPVAVLQTDLDGLDAELASAAAFMEANGFSPTIGKRIKDLEMEREILAVKLLEAKVHAASPVETAWAEYGSLLDAINKAPDATDARIRLRAAMRRVVDSILVMVVARGGSRVCLAQINFAGTTAFRSITIFYRPPRSNGKGNTPGRWDWRGTFVEPEKLLDLPRSYFGPFDAHDLRDPQEREWAGENLREYPKDVLDQVFQGGQPLP
jgi:DNA invertase Pin-like site-specific DNA recombinase